MREYINIDCINPTEDMMYSTEVIQECYDALDEGASDPVFIDTARKYAKSLLISVLDFVFNTLNKMLTGFIAKYNAFIVNDVRVADKYKKLIIEKQMEAFDKNSKYIEYEYYEYPSLYDYPKEIRQNMTSTADILQVMKQVKDNESPGTMSVDEYVDKKIVEFGQDVLDAKIKPDDLECSVRDAIKNKCRGSKITKRLDLSNIEPFYDDMHNTIKEYKKARAMRSSIVMYYKTLRHEIDKVYADVKEKRNPGNPNFVNANVDMSSYDGSLTDIELQKNKLLNGYIQIYKHSFTEKIEICQEKINKDSLIIASLFKTTSVFTGVKISK